MANTLHNALTANELHYSKIAVSTIGPLNPLPTPTYVGQSLFDEANNLFYVAIGILSPADWIPVTGSGGGNSVEDVAGATYTVLTTDNAATLRLTNVAARTITLPTAPINGFTVTLQDAANTAFTANITVNTGGSDQFQGGASSFKIVSGSSSTTFIYDYSSSEWCVKGGYIGFQPTLLYLRGTLGSALNIQTEDTSSILLNVNSVNALALTTTTATISVGGSVALSLTATTAEISIAGVSILALTGTTANLNLGGVNALSVGATNFEIKRVVLIDDISDNTKQVAFGIAAATTGTKTILNFVQTANRVLSFPDLTDTMVSLTSTDILTNKSFNNATTILAANQLNFNNSANTFHTSLKAGANLVDLDITLPTVAPAAGEVLYSTDTNGTLGWQPVISTVSPTYQLFISGSGTYTCPTSPRIPSYIRLRMVGGGGGGCGSGSSGGGSGGAGGTSGITSLAPPSIVATAGAGSGGTIASGGTGGNFAAPSGISKYFGWNGSSGGFSSEAYCGTINDFATVVGGAGGNGLFSGGGPGGASLLSSTGVGQNAVANTGGGGGGAGCSAGVGISITNPPVAISGSGGGAGGYIEAIIPAQDYSYTVGTGGTAGTAGTGYSARAGGAGANGFVLFEEYYD